MQLKAECNFSYRFLYNLVPNQYSKSSTHFLLCECRRRLKRFLVYSVACLGLMRPMANLKRKNI